MFTKITSTNPNFEQIKSQLAQSSDRCHYNALAREYNTLGVGELVSFPYTQGKLAVLAKQMEKRGLKRDADFTVQGNAVGEGKDQTYNAFVTRVSDKEAGILAPAARAPRAPKAEGAAGGNAKGGKGKGGK